jgi:hypothetical protein
MKTESNFIDYGVYIDRKCAFIISLDHAVHETFMQEDIQQPEGHPVDSTQVRHQVDVQNYKNEQLKKFCKAIIEKLVNAHQVLIFGPSISKFILQKEIHNVRLLKHVPLTLITTDVMEKDDALRFTKDHYTPIVVCNEIFTVSKKR